MKSVPMYLAFKMYKEKTIHFRYAPHINNSMGRQIYIDQVTPYSDLFVHDFNGGIVSLSRKLVKDTWDGASWAMRNGMAPPKLDKALKITELLGLGICPWKYNITGGK